MLPLWSSAMWVLIRKRVLKRMFVGLTHSCPLANLRNRTIRNGGNKSTRSPRSELYCACFSVCLRRFPAETCVCRVLVRRNMTHSLVFVRDMSFFWLIFEETNASWQCLVNQTWFYKMLQKPVWDVVAQSRKRFFVDACLFGSLIACWNHFFWMVLFNIVLPRIEDFLVVSNQDFNVLSWVICMRFRLSFRMCYWRMGFEWAKRQSVFTDTMPKKTRSIKKTFPLPLIGFDEAFFAGSGLIGMGVEPKSQT